MNLLVINFEMDSRSRSMPWSQEVVNRLARSCDRVAVLTHRVGRYEAPGNVEVAVIPLARLTGRPWLRELPVALARLQVLRLIRRHEIQVCFVHMAAPWAHFMRRIFQRFRIPVLVWHAHGSVGSDLRWAVRAATRVVTSSPEGCRVASDKIHVIGQGVDTDLYVPPAHRKDLPAMITITRISPRKRLELLVDVLADLRARPGALDWTLTVVGAAIGRADRAYAAKLAEHVRRRGLEKSVRFPGYVPQENHPALYAEAFLHLSASRTGSLDKTVLEALACGCPVLTTNEAFREVFRDHPVFFSQDDTAAVLADRVQRLYLDRHSHSSESLRRLVVGRHDLDSHVGRLLGHLREIAGSAS